ncbi:MAG: exodeoxyribonuclease III [Gemmatimonadota bacterium]|nr:MAG: exodeoxyribonuclease III [Gemmatimonadota bacterium]
MRIATWNVNGLRARLDFVVHWLRERAVDVVALQELKLTDEQFPHQELEALGYRAVTHGQKAWNGVALLARQDLEVTQTGLPGQEDAGARLISAQVAGVNVTSIYLPNGKSVDHEDFPGKLAWLDSLIDHFRKHHDPALPTVLGGDFNLVPEAIDSWNADKFEGSIFHTDEERARWRALLDWGFHDLFRETNPDAAEYSWWDYRGGAFHRKQGLRIDFLLGTRPIVERTRGVWIDRDYRKKKDGLTASDHAPVILELD